MITYYSKFEIEASIKIIVSEYLKCCIEHGAMQENFKDLIKHNFLAKYVSFNGEKRIIEIGIEDFENMNSYYSTIKKISFHLEENRNRWLEDSFKYSKNDLIFYGKLINRENYNYQDAEVVIV